MHSFVIGCLVDAKWQQFALPCYAKLIGLLLNTKNYEAKNAVQGWAGRGRLLA